MMLRTLVRTALKFRGVVVLLAAVLLVLGIESALNTPLDVFPEFAPPLVDIQTEAPGLTSEALEQLVTIPIESAVNGVPRLAVMRSKSVHGLSQVQLIFERGSDVLRARQMVTERVAVVAATLTTRAHTPRVLPPLSSTSRVLKVGLTSKTMPVTDLTALTQWVIEPRLRAVPGVANISIYGMKPKEYDVFIDPHHLAEQGVTLTQVKEAVRGAVAFGSPGAVDTPNQRLAVQVAPRKLEVDDLAQTVVTYRDRQPLRLGQLARVDVGTPLPIGEGVIDDRPGLLMVIEKSPEANTLQVTRGVDAALEALRPNLVGIDVATDIFRPAQFIERALANLREAMLLGCILVVMILALFLFDWRTAFISMTAIPLSIVAGLVVVSWLGETLNTMVLAGLAIAIGEVVDDAIIDVENIERRLRLNRQAGSPRSAFRVVLMASLEVRSAVVYASFIVICVCLPIFFIGGLAGSFFQPLALAYVAAVLASLFVALTVTPALCLILLGQRTPRTSDAPLVRQVKAIYRHILPPFLRWPALTLLMPVLLLAAAAFVATQLKEEYLPRFRETHFLMHWIAKPGTGLDVMTKDIVKMQQELLEAKLVHQAGAHIARAVIGEEVVGTNFAEVWVSMRDDAGDYDSTRKRIALICSRHAGFEHDLLTYLQERIKEVLSGTGASVVLRIYGPDLATLRRKADEVRRAIEGSSGEGKVAGVIDLKIESQALVPQLDMTLDPARLSRYGLSPKTVLDAVTTYLNGEKVGEVHQGQMAFDLVVRGEPHLFRNWIDLRRLELDVPGALLNGPGRTATLPLEAVADIQLLNAPNLVRHDKASRCIDVSFNLDGRDLNGVVAEVKRRLEPLQEPGYRVEYLGEYQARHENQLRLLWLSGLALLGVALLLYLDFQSLRLMLLTLFSLPFAVVGGVAAVYLADGVLSLGSLVGFITVFGIAARNGILLVSHYRHLRREEGLPHGRELVIRGAQERVAPILMTALAAGLGLLPLALSGNRPGYEIEYPMAVVILGGLVSSTVLNLLVVPALYLLFGNTRTVAT